ncbi:hypothetical protein BT69DRAFT_1277795, partial [Atractiella rhizophila]
MVVPVCLIVSKIPICSSINRSFIPFRVDLLPHIFTTNLTTKQCDLHVINFYVFSPDFALLKVLYSQVALIL